MAFGDVNKLPRWAQNEIQRLTRDLASAERKLAAGPEDSDTFADPYSENAMRPLGSGTTIMFGTKRGKRFRVRYVEDGKLDVNADEGLMVEPRVSNSVIISSRQP